MTEIRPGAHIAASANAHAIGAVTGLTDALADGRSEVLSSVTLLSTNHPATWTADAATNVLTSSAAHGLVVGEAIAFGAGTGALPAGLSPEPEYYYIVEVPTTTTLKVSLTYGGAAVDITDAGTAGWVVKMLPTPGAFSIAAFSLNNAEDVEVYYSTKWAVNKVANAATLMRVRFDDSVVPYVGSAGATPLAGIAQFPVPITKKYNRSVAVMRLRKVEAGIASMEFAWGLWESDVADFSSGSTYSTYNASGIVDYTAAGDITTLRLYDHRNARLLSGATSITVRRP